MTLDRRLAEAARGVADRLTPPEVNLDMVRNRARANRLRNISLTAAAAVAAVTVAVTLVVVNRDVSDPPVRPVGPIKSVAPDVDNAGCATEPRERPMAAMTGEAIVASQQGWVDQLPVGAPPMTPWWHEGVLHVRDDEFQTPSPTEILVAGDTVLIGAQESDGQGNVTSSEWALVRDGELEPLPAGASNAGLSVDGQIAYWDADPNGKSTHQVTWDVETHEELATHSMPDPFNHRVQLVGIDENGIAYLVDARKDDPITTWDLRADTIAPSDLTWDEFKAFSEQCQPLSQLAVWPYENGYTSPDGTREVFTGPAPGDASADCCTTQLRVRPAGDVNSIGTKDITTLQLPEGIPHMTLWRPYSDRGTWGVWWETNETLLLDAVVDGHSYLVRCSVAGGACQQVFDLGPNSSEGIMYSTDWNGDWAFARAPVTE